MSSWEAVIGNQLDKERKTKTRTMEQVIEEESMLSERLQKKFESYLRDYFERHTVDVDYIIAKILGYENVEVSLAAKVSDYSSRLRKIKAQFHSDTYNEIPLIMSLPEAQTKQYISSDELKRRYQFICHIIENCVEPLIKLIIESEGNQSFQDWQNTKEARQKEHKARMKNSDELIQSANRVIDEHKRRTAAANNSNNSNSISIFSSGYWFSDKSKTQRPADNGYVAPKSESTVYARLFGSHQKQLTAQNSTLTVPVVSASPSYGNTLNNFSD